MTQIKSSIIQPTLRSLIPLLVGSSCYLFKNLLSNDFKIQLRQNSHNNFLDSFVIENHSLGTQVADNRDLADFFGMLSEIIFGIYNNYFAFLLVMLLIDMIFRIAQQGIKSTLKSVKFSRILPMNTYDDGLSSEFVKITVKKSFFIRILCYSIIFMVFQMTAGLWINFLNIKGSALINDQVPTMTMEKSMRTLDQEEENMKSNHIPKRVLEEIVTQDTEAKIDSIPLQTISGEIEKSEKISLSMGNILGSLNVDVTAMVLSKDEKYAFVTLDYYGVMKIIDISDLQAPFIVSSLSLKVSGSTFRIKTLALSSDEKTLYVSNSRDLEIIDVSQLGSPRVVSSTNSQIFNETSFSTISRYFKTSLAVDEKTKTLFIGGLGLQVYDISDPEDPILLKAYKNDLIDVEFFKSKTIQRNDLCLSNDGQVLLVANGTLDIYNISDPKDIRLINSYPTESSARSIYLSKDGKTAFLLGTSSENQDMILEEVDLSNYLAAPIVKKSFTLKGYQSTYSPRILAVSPSKTKFYIFTDENHQGYDLVVFDSVKGNVARNRKSLIEKTWTMTFAKDGRTLITGSNDQFVLIELFANYPNSQRFGPINDLVANFSLGSVYEQMEVSQDGKILFILRQDPAKEDSSFSIFEIWDLKDLKAPKMIESYPSKQIVYQMKFGNDYRTAYLVGPMKISILDISPDRSGISVKKTYAAKDANNQFFQLMTSSDEKTGFLARVDGSDVVISFFNFSKPEIESFVTLPRKFTSENCRMMLKDEKTLVVLDREIIIYDISNIGSPVEIVALPLVTSDPEPFINSHVLSSNKNTLYVETYNQNRFSQLRIYDISNRASPRFMSEQTFSKFNPLSFKPGFSLMPDLRNGLMFEESSLVRVDLSDLKKPKISGVIPLSTNKSEQFSDYILSPDGQTIFAVTTEKEIRILNINLKYTLYLKREKFLLGEKYSDKVLMLASGVKSSDYDILEENAYKVIKLSLLNIKIVPSQYSPEITTSLLPPWITFDKQSNLLTVDPKKQRDIGTYTFQSALSLKIPMSIIDELEARISSENLLAWLISLNYVDNELFLTEKFNSIETFILPLQFKDYKSEIYNILKQFYVETCTGFEIASSLELNSADKSLIVSTLNPSEVKVEIQLFTYLETKAKFLSKPYGSLVPVINEDKSKLSLEGTMKEINEALESIIVNFEKGFNCDAGFMIYDGLNPSIGKYLPDIAKYFKQNKPPSLNEEIQEQINSVKVETGEYFTIPIKKESFNDEYPVGLRYEIGMPNNKSAVPNWLSLNGLTLRGTPPEEIFGRDVDLVLIVKNEFKQHEVPFKLHVKISSVFMLKLLFKYSPYILTLIGLLVSLNHILNIIGKKWYKHPKQFYLDVGEEVSSQVIFPISFIEDEQKQSQLIFRNMIKRFSLNDFIDEMTGNMNKQKIIDAISETINQMPIDDKEKITLYPSSLMDQIIMNKFVEIQLNSTKEVKTKLLFEDLKPNCLEIVEQDESSSSSAGGGGFKINQMKLDKLLKRVNRKKAKENLLNNDESQVNLIEFTGVNMELLKDAIIKYAFESHAIDASPVDVDIQVQQKIPTGNFFKFLKFDLSSISFNDKNKIDYGINYKIIDDKLCFSGVVRKNFKDKTLAVHITNKKHRIIKELWIHGVLDKRLQRDSDMLIIRNESEASNRGYEIY